jgi:adenylate cyclase
MASFPSVQKALECSLALQKTFASEEIAGEQLRCRIGINAGEPIAEDGDLFGQTVITAARIAAHAEGGEVLVADVVRQLVAGKGFTFEDRGEQRLKGLTEPVRLWSVV